jgi:alpha-beta hydrolase superfamily lysophospholipase
MEKEYFLACGKMKTPCVLNHPDHGTVRRVVLGVHGFGGSTHDEIQVGIAEEMSMFGAATLRFDFPAHGQNPAQELTLCSCVDTILTVASHARETYPEVEDLCIFASGFGAYVTLTALHDLLELPGRIRLVVQTPAVRMADTLLAMGHISRETFRAMGAITLNAPRPFEATYRFYEELWAHPVIGDYPIPMLILHGEADDFIRMEDVRHLHRLNEQSRLVIIPGTSHRFLEEGAWDMVLDLTRDWFEFEQVLLSDWN